MRENLILILILRSVAKLSLETLNYDFMNRGMGKIKSEFDLKGSRLTIGARPAGRKRERERKRVRERVSEG